MTEHENGETEPPASGVPPEPSSLGDPVEEAIFASTEAEMATTDLVASLVLSKMTATVHSSPIPSPETLAGYAAILPNAPDRLLAMAERSLGHQIDVEQRSSKVEALLGVLGLVFAFIIALLVLAGSIWLISDGEQAAGSILATVDLVALVTVFIVGRKSR